MGRVLKIGPTQLDRFVQQGCPREPNGRFYPSKVRQWISDREQQKAKAAELKLTKLRAEVRQLKTRDEERKLGMAIKRGELHPIRECQASLGEALASIFTQLQGLPQRLQSAFPEATGLKDVTIRELNKSIGQIREYAKAHAGKPL